MSKKDLEKFKPEKLKPGRTFSTTVVADNGFHRCHFFHRDRDGELFHTITRNRETGRAELRAWQNTMPAMNDLAHNGQPGNPEQLASVVDAAERYYESSLSRNGHAVILVFWDEHPVNFGRYRLCHAHHYKGDPCHEVIRIPK